MLTIDLRSAKKNGGPKAAVSVRRVARRLLEQAEHVLVGLRGERQGGGRQLLAGLQGEQVGAFLVGVGERQVVGAGLQRVDRRLGEVLADLHGRQARAERLGLRAQLVSAAVRSVEAAVMSAAPAQLLAALLIARGRSRWCRSTPVIVTLEVPVSFSVTVRLSPFEQVDAVEARSRRRAGRSGSGSRRTGVARLARTVVSEVCCAWQTSAWADCTSLVIERCRCWPPGWC